MQEERGKRYEKRIVERRQENLPVASPLFLRRQRVFLTIRHFYLLPRAFISIHTKQQTSSSLLRLPPIAKWSFILSSEFSVSRSLVSLASWLLFIPSRTLYPAFFDSSLFEHPRQELRAFSRSSSLRLYQKTSHPVYLRTDRSLCRLLHIYCRWSISVFFPWARQGIFHRRIDVGLLSASNITSILTNRHCLPLKS